MIQEQITFTLDLPTGLVQPGVDLVFRPATVEEFNAIVDAAGGAHKFRACGTFAFADITGATVRVHQPEEVKPRLVPEPPSFMREFAKRSDEARDFIQTLERDAAGRAA